MEELSSNSWKKFIKNGYRIFLGTGGLIALLFGEPLIRWYLETFIPR